MRPLKSTYAQVMSLSRLIKSLGSAYLSMYNEMTLLFLVWAPP